MKIFSNKLFKIFNLILILAIIFIIVSCKEDTTPSLGELIAPSGANPKITSIEPAGEALAQVTKVTINGENFSVDTTRNIVFFGTARARILEASDTKIVVLAPKILGDSLDVRVAATGELYSNVVKYKIKPPVAIPFEFQSFEKPHGITTDNQENIYVALEGYGVKKITPDLQYVDYAPKGNETFWSSLKYGPSSTIYSARNSRGVWQIFEKTQPTSSPWAITPSGTRIDDIDFDSNLNIWTVGASSNIYIIRITPAGDAKTFKFDGSTFRGIRFFNNSIYVGGKYNGKEGVWSIPIISADSLGSPTLYFDFSSDFATAQVNAITFAQDGDLYIGSSRDINPIIIVHPDKSFEELYPGLIKQAFTDISYSSKPDVEAFTWGPGNYLYFTQRAFTVLKLDMQKPGAPQYGRN